jgi:HD-GYP domain-containing protein (c-di-GMP phosphodiesterase class II)
MPPRRNATHSRSPGTAEATVCSVCGSRATDRFYRRLDDRHTCEHCVLDAHKHAAGLVTDPYELFAESLAATLDLREHETGLHSKRVAAHTLRLAQRFYRDATELKEVYWGSLLHDIGKIGVPDAILLKHGPLSDEEWQVMRQHPVYGFRILENIPHLAAAAQIVLHHEERFDGTGYPSGARGNEIPLPARLFAVIDTLDAMTFDRPYRKALSFDDAKAEIVRMSGSQFDPIAVDAFLQEEQMLREMAALEAHPIHRHA